MSAPVPATALYTKSPAKWNLKREQENTRFYFQVLLKSQWVLPWPMTLKRQPLFISLSLYHALHVLLSGFISPCRPSKHLTTTRYLYYLCCLCLPPPARQSVSWGWRFEPVSLTSVSPASESAFAHNWNSQYVYWVSKWVRILLNPLVVFSAHQSSNSPRT